MTQSELEVTEEGNVSIGVHAAKAAVVLRASGAKGQWYRAAEVPSANGTEVHWHWVER